MAKEISPKITNEVSMSLIQDQDSELTKLVGDLAGFEKFVSIRLYQFPLLRSYTVQDVVNECVKRYCEARAKGKQIPNADGWLRRTALNFIHELSREEKKADVCDPVTFDFLVVGGRDDEVDSAYQSLYSAISVLSSEKRELLELRFFQKLSWEEIALWYRDRGIHIQPSTLRKRGERALEALRVIYLKMAQE
jgi:DNA-directed RNA polymerase specialized sigma24 family protein